jgi:uncharacterized protein YjbI with pentapeptide repeats
MVRLATLLPSAPRSAAPIMRSEASPIGGAARAFLPLLASALLTAQLTGPPLEALADGDTKEFRFPPVNRAQKGRCSFQSSAMGQSNAARDSLYDLRECEMSGKDAGGFDISGALLASGDFSKVNFKEAQLSKVYA